MLKTFNEPAAGQAAPIIALDEVSKSFVKRIGLIERAANLFGAGLSDEVAQAVRKVDLSIRPGEVVGLAGESGCGKTTLGRIAAGLLEPSEGTVRLDGVDVARLSRARRNRLWLPVQMVFQDPMSSLNPKLSVGKAVGEAALYHRVVPSAELDEYVARLLQQVGLDPAAAGRMPHQFSGGQRARVGIARALAVQPRFLVCDESVAALDVSIQAQILNLFMKLRRELQLTYLFISHNLGVLEHVSDRIAIMYLGRIVEMARTDELFRRPNHPYTKALLNEVPKIGVGKQKFSPVAGEIPSPLNPPSGCHFHPRCPLAFDRCRREAPSLNQVASGHVSACHLNEVR